MAGTLKLLLRSCTAATRRRFELVGQVKLAFFGVSQTRNVSSRPIAQWAAGFDFRNAGDIRRRFSSAGDATHHDVNEDGSNESSLMKSMANKIKDQLSAESVIVKDASGDGRHVCIYVVSSAFEGQSAVNRQRMVYKAMWEELQSTVHAVDHMITRTPSEAGLDK